MTLLERLDPDLRGAQRPRIACIPEYFSSAGDDAIDLAAEAGLDLDPWQQYVLTHALGERPGNAKWAAPTVALVCPRQNGKNSILEARELAGLFLFNEKNIIHSAHEQATASEQFLRVLELIDGTPWMRNLMDRPIRGKGSEAIVMRSGQRIFFKTRTGGGARGFSVDCVVFDEAYELPERAISAMVPTKSARPNTQLWYTSSAVDQLEHPNGIVLARKRELGIAKTAGIAYFEWSAVGEDPANVPEDIASDPYVWAGCNPGYGVRLLAENIEQEFKVDLGPRQFAVERLGIGDWPDTSGNAGRAIDLNAWKSLTDDESRRDGPVRFAFDTTPDRSMSAVAVAGKREDGLSHVEVTDHRPGTAWVADRIVSLVKQHRAGAVICDPSSPAASLIAELEQAGIKVQPVTTREHAQACGLLYDAVAERTLRHRRDDALTDAVSGAKKAPFGDAWKWSRKNSGVDISPLVAVTLAHWALETQKPVRSRVINLNNV